MVKEKEITVKINITETEYNKNKSEMERPEVFVDGEKLDNQVDIANKVRIKGKTLDVYYFLIKNSGFHGVREIQRALGHSSAGLTLYHLKRLLNVKAIIKNEFGQYSIEKDEVKLGSLEDHVKFINYWIPRTIIFGSILLILGLTGLLYLIFNINSVLFMIIFILSTVLLAIILFVDSIKMISKLKHSQNEEKSEQKDDLNLLRKRLIQALALKSSKRAKNKFEAQNIFEEIISDEIIDYELTIFAMFNLCDLLLDELKLYGEKEVINEVIRLTEKVYIIAAEESSTTLLIEALLLQHKFELIHGQIESANEKLIEAFEIAEKNSLSDMRESILTEKNKFENEISKWRNTADSSIYKRIEQTQIKDYIRTLEIMNLVNLNNKI